MDQSGDGKTSFEKKIHRIAGVVISLGVIIGGIAAVVKYTPGNASEVMTVLAALNLIPLAAFFRTKPTRQRLNKKCEGRYREILNVKPNAESYGFKSAAVNVRRVNLLVRQLHTNIISYAAFLIVVYLLYIFSNEKIYARIFPFGVDYKTIRPVFDLVINVCNYLSAVCLYLGFKVLYAKTVNDDATPVNYYKGSLLFSIPFLLFYIIVYYLIHASNSAGENQTVLNLFQLFIGSYNGLAMALLFGRYVSMEQSAYNMKVGIYAEGKYNNIIQLCTIYILPVYALAQPLFGSFYISGFGGPYVLANAVFLFCLIGKAFFLSLTYIFMKQRLMHLYLHSVITSHGIPSDLVGCFKS